MFLLEKKVFFFSFLFFSQRGLKRSDFDLWVVGWCCDLAVDRFSADDHSSLISSVGRYGFIRNDA